MGSYRHFLHILLNIFSHFLAQLRLSLFMLLIILNEDMIDALGYSYISPSIALIYITF